MKETYDESRFHSVVPVERRLQIETHLEQYQAVIQEHLHGHRHVSEHVWMSSTRRTRRLYWSTEKCTYRVYCRRSRHDGAATRSRKGVGVYSTLTSCSPPVTSVITTTTTTKSWRSDTLIILPGWECHTGGSRSKPTVHRCSQSGRRLWVARQVHNHEPNGSAAVRQCQPKKKKKKKKDKKQEKKIKKRLKKKEKTEKKQRKKKRTKKKKKERENESMVVREMFLCALEPNAHV